MTSEQIVELIDRMQSAWPKDVWTPGRVDEWCTALEGLDFDVAAVACGKLVRSRTWVPSIAEFYAEAHSESERRRMGPEVTTPDEDRDLPPADRSVAQRVMTELRRAFAARPVHDHHGGYRSCPTCVRYPPKAPTGNPKDWP